MNLRWLLSRIPVISNAGQLFRRALLSSASGIAIQWSAGGLWTPSASRSLLKYFVLIVEADSETDSIDVLRSNHPAQILRPFDVDGMPCYNHVSLVSLLEL